MKEKGFTLIELISTIVILGIVFTIVSVLVLGIVRSAKENAKKRNIDLYGKMVETAMAEYQSQNLKYPDKIEDLTIEYTGPKVECDIQRINPDHTIYLSDCKVNNKLVSKYHYGTLVLTDEEYVDKLGENIETAINKYYKQYNKYPINYRLLELPKLDKNVNCVSDINPNGTVYLTRCTVDGKAVKNKSEEDGYYHYGESLTAVNYLLKKTNGKEITSYTDGNTHEMYTFDHGVTEQTPALTDYRYIGNEPYNYVKIGSSNTADMWRVVGVFEVENSNGTFEKRVKIVKEYSVYYGQWTNSSSTNEWEESSIETYLNTYSYNNELQKMISPANYYLGGRENNLADGETFYISERSKNVYSSERSINWVGKVGLIYPSDYIYTYALGVDDTCYNTPGSCNNGNPLSGWINISSYFWLLSPFSTGNNQNFFISRQGKINNYYEGLGNGAATPTVYLSPKVKIVSGDGSESNPYKLSL